MPPFRMNSARTQLEAWLTRGTEQLRIFGQRAAADRQHLAPEVFTTALQPVQNGVVEAWRPLWREELSVGEIYARVAALIEQGWRLTSTRPSTDWRAVGRMNGLRHGRQAAR